MAGTVMSPVEALDALGTVRGRQDPYPLYEAIRAHGQAVPTKPGRFVVVGHDACDRALREPALRVQDGRSYDVV
ncbi:cytochrome P450, partial [Streptomyces sp. NPDC058155]